jgi:hypothetical protein
MRSQERDRRSWSFIGLPTLGLLDTPALWMSGTALALLTVAFAGLVSGLILYVASRRHWISTATELKLRARLRVVFGILFLAATTLPFLLAQIPTLTVAFGLISLLAYIPYRLYRRSETEKRPARDSVPVDPVDVTR